MEASILAQFFADFDVRPSAGQVGGDDDVADSEFSFLEREFFIVASVAVNRQLLVVQFRL